MRACIVVALASLLLVAQIACTRRSIAPRDPVADNLRLTSAKGPLPREAFKAQISFAYEAPAQLRAGDRTPIHLLVKNTSEVWWPSGGQADGKYQVRVGNRWLDQTGNSVDDGRGALSYDLAPGDEAEVAIVVTAPRTPGNYWLEFDLVQEQITWFSQMGSETLRLKLTVE